MTALAVDIPTAKVFEPLLPPARYKGAWGGRGSGKSHFFASLMVEDHLANPGMRSVCIREVQKSLKESAKRLLESKIEEFGLRERDGFRVLTDRIDTPGGGTIIFQGMQDHTAESIKSLEGFNRAWVEEAQALSATSLRLLRPTIRAPGSELWFSWNPRLKNDPVDVMLRGAAVPSNSTVIRANWNDNPWLPDELEQERQDCLRATPDQYDHIWDGGYIAVADGAYFAQQMVAARNQGRLCRIAADPLMTIRAVWDIGGTGAKADATAIWIVQYIGKEIRFLDYYEAVGQPLAAHVQWLRSQGYESALCILPHDGAAHDKVHQTTYEGALRQAGFAVEVVPNQGAGAAMQRIETARRLFPQMWFDAEKCAGGIDAISWYHEKRDEKRNLGLGPEHDWSSHGCLVAGTLVDTARGAIPIEDVIAGDMVRTPCGYAAVSWAGVTKETDELVETVLSDGRTLTSTAEHKIFTTIGLLKADALGYGSPVITEDTVSWMPLENASRIGARDAFIANIAARNIGFGRSAASTFRKWAASSAFFIASFLDVTRPMRLIPSMETLTTSTGGTGRLKNVMQRRSLWASPRMPAMNGRSITASAITAPVTVISPARPLPTDTCTGMYGKTPTVPFQTAITFITSMKTRVITLSKIWSAYRRPNMPSITEERIGGSAALEAGSRWLRHKSPLLNGIGANRVASGTRNTESAHGPSANPIQSHVNSAARNTKRLGRRDPAFARVVASRGFTVASPVKVYDLTVEHDHCYYANGILVSNSDAFGLAAIAYREPVSSAPIKYSRRGIV